MRAIALPIKLGMKGGFNACFITDANNSTLCQMYGIPMHTTVEEVRAIDDPHGRWTDGLKKADELVKIVNTYEQTQADIAEALKELEAAEMHLSTNYCANGHSMNESDAMTHLRKAVSILKGQS